MKSPEVKTSEELEVKTPEKELETKTSEEELKTGYSKDGLDGTADWKTYRNEEYGFEIQYPPILESAYHCSIGDLRSVIAIGPVLLKVYDSQGLTLDEWVNKEIDQTEEETKKYKKYLSRKDMKIGKTLDQSYYRVKSFLKVEKEV